MSETVNEMIQQPEAAAPENAQSKPAKKKLSDIFHNHSNAKVLRVLRVILGVLLLLLGAVQLTRMGLMIYEQFPDYIDVILEPDYVGIAWLAMCVIFIVALLAGWIVTLVSLIVKGHLVRFDIASTLIAQTVLCLFAEHLLSGLDVSLLQIPEAMLYCLAALVIVYAFLRLFSLDFSTRIAPVICSICAAVVAVILFAQNAGNFAVLRIGGEHGVELTELNLLRYLCDAFELLKTGSGPDSLEYQFLYMGAGLMVNDSIAYAALILLPELLMVAGATLLPFAALSLMGYLIHGLTCPNYLQYHNLHACQKVAISMLIVAILSAGAAAGMMLLLPALEIYTLSVELNYTNMIVTGALCVALIVLTAVPWSIHRSIYRRRLAAFNERERRN